MSYGSTTRRAGEDFHAARAAVPSLRPKARLIASKILRAAGAEATPPSKPALILDVIRSRLTRRRRRGPSLGATLRRAVGPLLVKYPDLVQRLGTDGWKDGGALGDHDRSAAFSDDLYAALHGLLAPSLLASLVRRDPGGIMGHLTAYLTLEAAQLPYLFSLFHQNKERPFVERLEHDCSGGRAVLERPMRVSLFTDTLGDINGVSRFIQNVADVANRTGRDLHVITSTKYPCPTWPNIFNFDPVVAMKMPKYENLDLCLPPLIKMLRHVDKHQPDVIHVSTPGPVGVAGLIAARMLRVPVLGVYHTDFPAYIDRLFDDHALTWITGRAMRAFYSPFRSIFTRSADYIESLVGLGMPRERILPLMPGVDTSLFHPRFADRSRWSEHGMDPDVFKAIYVGRISIEKNMPLLTTVWRQTRERLVRGTALGGTALGGTALGGTALRAVSSGMSPDRTARRAVPPDLVIVGDGPYRATMERELSGLGVHFLGFRHGEELSRLYASSDLFVFPSVTDTLGQVVMESQASGIPVLVTDRGGPKEVVRNGVTGLVLPPEPARPWADAIAGLVADPDRRRRWGAAAFESMQSMSITDSFEHFWNVHEEAWRTHLATQGIVSRKHESAPAQLVPSAALQLSHPVNAAQAPA